MSVVYHSGAIRSVIVRTPVLEAFHLFACFQVVVVVVVCFCFLF